MTAGDNAQLNSHIVRLSALDQSVVRVRNAKAEFEACDKPVLTDEFNQSKLTLHVLRKHFCKPCTKTDSGCYYLNVLHMGPKVEKPFLKQTDILTALIYHRINKA